MKYFSVISDEKKELLEFNKGKTEIIFSSRLTHKKNILWDEAANTTLAAKSNQNPKTGVKNIIGP